MCKMSTIKRNDYIYYSNNSTTTKLDLLEPDRIPFPQQLLSIRGSKELSREGSVLRNKWFNSPA